MKRFVAVLGCLLLASSQAEAQAAAPSGPPPQLKLVHSTDPAKGLILIKYAITQMVPVQVERELVVDGKKVKQVSTEYVGSVEERMNQIDATSSRIITPDGKQLPIDEVWKRIRANTVVAVSSNSQPPAQAYLQALNPATLVIIQMPPMPPKNK